MISKRITLLFVSAVMIAMAAAGAGLLPCGMPRNLQEMPPKAKEAAQEIQDILAQQQGLIEKAAQAKTAQEREEVFRAVERNVQAIAQKRVVVLEHYTRRARARVEWARKHASEVRVSDLAGAMQELDTQGPRSPFRDEPNIPSRVENSPHTRLPERVLSARSGLKRTVKRLEALSHDCKLASTDEQRTKIRQEIQEHLTTIERERIAILEAILKVSEQRLGDAKKRARDAGVLPVSHESQE